MGLIAAGGRLGLAILAIVGVIFCEKLWVRIACAALIAVQLGLWCWRPLEHFGLHDLWMPALLMMFAVFVYGVKKRTEKW